MGVPVSPAVVAIASDTRFLIMPFWSKCAPSLYCLPSLAISQSCCNQLCGQILPSVPFSFKADLINFFSFWFTSQPWKQLYLQQLKWWCVMLWDWKWATGGKRGWKFFKLIFLSYFLHCERPASDPCLNGGDSPFRCPPAKRCIQNTQLTGL